MKKGFLWISSMHSPNICVITHFQDNVNIELMKKYNL